MAVGNWVVNWEACKLSEWFNWIGLFSFIVRSLNKLLGAKYLKAKHIQNEVIDIYWTVKINGKLESLCKDESRNSDSRDGKTENIRERHLQMNLFFLNN